MGTKARNRLGDDYGGSLVIRRGDNITPTWVIKWKCCNKEQEVTNAKCHALSRSETSRCPDCIKKAAENNPKNHTSGALRSKARRQLRGLTKDSTDEEPVGFVMANGQPWFFLCSNHKLFIPKD